MAKSPRPLSAGIQLGDASSNLVRGVGRIANWHCVGLQTRTTKFNSWYALCAQMDSTGCQRVLKTRAAPWRLEVQVLFWAFRDTLSQ